MNIKKGIKLKILCVVFIVLNSLIGFSSNTNSVPKNANITVYAQIPQWVLDSWETRTANTGIWVAKNSEYKNDQEPIDSYAIKWEYGIGKKHLQGRLYALRDGEDIGSIWQFLEYWDPVESQLKITQIGSDGTIGIGESWKTEDGKTKELQTFVTPEGQKYSSGHIAWMENGVNHTQSYNVNGVEWTKSRYYEWKLKKAEKVIEIPDE